MEKSFIQNIQKKCIKNLGFLPQTFLPVKGGMNNQIFKMVDGSGKAYLLKIYTKDGKNRLEREYQACEFLSKNNFSVPKVYYKDDKLYYGIYSFEEGETKLSSELEENEIEAMVDFIVRLEGCRPSYSSFLPADMACFCLDDYFRNIGSRLKMLEENIGKKDFDTDALSFIKENDIINYIKNKRDSLLKEISTSGLSDRLSEKQRTLSPVDFGPHNMLFRGGKPPVFIDFEKFGWDDPVRLIALFVNHIKTAGMTLEKKKFFLNLYFRKSKLSGFYKKRFSLVVRIDALDWLTMVVCALTPEKIKHYLSVNSDFKRSEYVNLQIKETECRIKEMKGTFYD